ncbi:MAG: choline-sulfatase [Alphaproteobacteria bacterium]|jgi:choline-sulfatase|nr:choline-sulfatase [Alphaproteobacteria bacterium]MDP6813693.1 choline-sulfatase [Alphaproteobacteria bacterium]
MTTKPNFLFIQADQLAARALPAYGNRVAKTPHIDGLAESGAVFEHAYCNYPLCAPSRFSMMSGLLASHAGAYDNGAEFPASLPTFIHYLRLLGYQTCLSGKMHFIGPDQLHGFEERLTTDIYPSDFNWTANWESTVTGSERLLAAAGEVNGILHSGIYERTVQLDFDEEVAFKANRKIHDLARSDDDRPFCLFVSFTHPHDPFAIPRRYWERYRHEDIDLPAVPAMPRVDLDAHSQRLFDHIGVAEAAMSEADVRVARHAYYGAVSYIDDQVGALLDSLQVAGFAEDTIIVFLSDHGEALGERGLWFKRSFFDCAVQVPLIVSAPNLFAPARCAGNVSLVDLLPTVVDLANAGGGLDTIATQFDGYSLRPLLLGEASDRPDRVFAEMSGEGLQATSIMVVDGDYKYIQCQGDPALLFDRSTDANETRNLAGRAEVAETQAGLAAIVAENWELDGFRERVVESQRCRHLIDRAHALGRAPSWDYDVPTPGSAQYFRPSARNPSASNYNDDFEIRARPDGEGANQRDFP